MSDHKEGKQKSSCPSAEIVGAFFDGELPKGSPEAAHIAECVECAKTVASYKALSMAIRRQTAAAVPKDLNERIISTVKRRAMTPYTIPFPAYAIRVAAGIVAFGAAATVLVSVWNGGLDPSKDSPSPSSVSVAAKTSIPSSGTTFKPAPPTLSAASRPAPEFGARRQPFTAKTEITMLPDLKPVSFGVDAFKEGSTASDKQESIAKIGSLVRQVWVADDLKRQAAEFPSVVEAVGGICGKPETRQGRVELQAKLTKAQLVELVRRCAASGLKLTSPDQPQPEQERFSDGATEPVAYFAELVAE